MTKSKIQGTGRTYKMLTELLNDIDGVKRPTGEPLIDILVTGATDPLCDLMIRRLESMARARGASTELPHFRKLVLTWANGLGACVFFALHEKDLREFTFDLVYMDHYKG